MANVNELLTKANTSIDLSGARTALDLHRHLARELQFPSWYGHNWDAFWDCATDPELSTLPRHLVVSGTTQLEAVLPREAENLRACLRDLEARGGFSFEWE